MMRELTNLLFVSFFERLSSRSITANIKGLLFILSSCELCEQLATIHPYSEKKSMDNLRAKKGRLKFIPIELRGNRSQSHRNKCGLLNCLTNKFNKRFSRGNEQVASLMSVTNPWVVGPVWTLAQYGYASRDKQLPSENLKRFKPRLHKRLHGLTKWNKGLMARPGGSRVLPTASPVRARQALIQSLLLPEKLRWKNRND
jgi:hypothetical protein